MRGIGAGHSESRGLLLWGWLPNCTHNPKQKIKHGVCKALEELFHGRSHARSPCKLEKTDKRKKILSVLGIGLVLLIMRFTPVNPGKKRRGRVLNFKNRPGSHLFLWKVSQWFLGQLSLLGQLLWALEGPNSGSLAAYEHLEHSTLTSRPLTLMRALVFSALQPYSYYYLLLCSAQLESSPRGNGNGALLHPFQMPAKFPVWPCAYSALFSDRRRGCESCRDQTRLLHSGFVPSTRGL